MSRCDLEKSCREHAYARACVMQYGEIIVPLPGHRYLAVHVDGANRLPAMDISGLSDAFVSIEWGGMTQRTKTVRGGASRFRVNRVAALPPMQIFKNLDPQFDQTLYFPVRAVRRRRSWP